MSNRDPRRPTRVTPERSRNMAAIRSTDTEPEFRVRRALHKRGLRYILHHPHLPGKPDLVFPKYETVLFVNGCFWHGHNCPAAKLPATNTVFWRDKINSNIARDKRVDSNLRKLGWRVIVVWQCKLPRRSDGHATYWDRLASRVRAK